MWIGIEGIDGSGKSTLCDALAHDAVLADGATLVVIDELPENRPLRHIYRRLISARETFPNARKSLWLSLADYEDLSSQVDRASENIVVSHRTAISALADGIALGVSKETILAVCEEIRVPDIIIFLETDVTLATSRKRKVSFAESGGPQFMTRAGTAFERFFNYQTCVRKAYEWLLTEPLASRSKIVRISGEVIVSAQSEIARAHIIGQMKLA
ncbi:Thymidylate kinase [Pseudomonas sp. NFR09]|uniref:hypothetical protein n=1 Tax=Pseudomonas sp. NFR09 TaxID=1566249 RepID=UPI0008B35B61|nr:hypothetical protein [Pseudomonas sp. NFR09]SEU14293.1 Thymidylate kinase [Pseudomonas sp. NFR09]